MASSNNLKEIGWENETHAIDSEVKLPPSVQESLQGQLSIGSSVKTIGALNVNSFAGNQGSITFAAGGTSQGDDLVKRDELQAGLHKVEGKIDEGDKKKSKEIQKLGEQMQAGLEIVKDQAKQMQAGFQKVDDKIDEGDKKKTKEIQNLDEQMQAGFQIVEDQGKQMQAGFQKVEDKIDKDGKKKSKEIQKLGEQMQAGFQIVENQGKQMQAGFQIVEDQGKQIQTGLQIVEDKIKDLTRVEMVGDDAKNIKPDQKMCIDDVRSLLRSLLKLATETKHHVESLSSGKPTEVQAKENEDVSTLRATIAVAITTLQDKLMETNSTEAERNQTELKIDRAQQEQVLSTIVDTQQKLQSVVEQAARVQARVEHSELQIKEAVRQLGSQKGGGIIVPLSPQFRKNLGTLKDHMKRFDEVVIYLYQQFAITDDDVEELKETKSRDKVKCLVEFLNLENDGFRKLMDALNNTDQKALVDAMKD